MAKTIAEMTAEIREVNVEKGWRPAAGGPGENTWGDYVALLHSEISEALEAYRDHRLADATKVCTSEGGEGGCDIHGHEPIKPEGVGSELADVLIRLLDMADVFGVEVREMDPLDCDASGMESFGDYLAWLHYLTAQTVGPDFPGSGASVSFSELLQAVWVTAMRHEIDLDAEYERKIAYNRTRAFQHGGRTLAGTADPQLASGGGKTTRWNALWMAMPTDPRDWWTGEEVAAFTDQWERLDLPKLTLSDAQGEQLFLWCTDVRHAAALIDWSDHVTSDNSFSITRGEYEVCIVQAEEKKETNSGNS